jgi:hypothetical protein
MSISQDSLPPDSCLYPKKIIINGAPLIAYTLEQDIEIIRTKVENDLLYKKLINRDSLLSIKDEYILDQEGTIFMLLSNRDTMRSIIKTQGEQIGDLETSLELSETNSEIYKTEANKFRIKNKGLWIAGSIIVAGLTTALIIK